MWEKLFLKSWIVWFAILVISIAFLNFDRPFWAIVLWLAYIGYQLMLLVISIFFKNSDH